MFGIHIDPSQFNLQSTLIAIVAFIVLVGIMVLVHEAGHFLVAKACRVRVEAFSIGFGPRLFGMKWGDTDYKICALPLGGFVKMTGENPGEESEASDPGSFLAHPRWQRMLIGLAGPVANFVLAFGLMFFYYAAINEVPQDEPRQTIIEWVVPNSAASRAGLEPGDVIRRVQEAQDPDWELVFQRLAAGQGQNVALTVERKGALHDVSLFASMPSRNTDDIPNIAGMIPQLRTTPVRVDEVVAGGPASQAGLRPGDKLLAVDNYHFDRLEPMLLYLQAGQGKPIVLTVERDGAQLPPMTVKPQDSGDKTPFPWKIGFRGSPQPGPTRNEPVAIPVAFSHATTFSKENSTLVLHVLGKLFTRQVSVNQLSGPVGIAVVAGQAAESRGWEPKFQLAAAISINLGILNLLPFPILDGGLILFLVIESLIRRDISMPVKERIYQAAFVLIVVFFAFVIFNDVSRLPIFTHARP